MPDAVHRLHDRRMTLRSVIELQNPGSQSVAVPRRDWRRFFTEFRRRRQTGPTAVAGPDLGVDHDLDFGLVVAAVPAQRSAPRASRPAGPAQSDAIEQRLRTLADRLLAEAEGDPARQETIRSSLADVHARFATAAVRDYLPILVERAVRQQLRARAGADVPATATVALRARQSHPARAMPQHRPVPTVPPASPGADTPHVVRRTTTTLEAGTVMTTTAGTAEALPRPRSGRGGGAATRTAPATGSAPTPAERTERGRAARAAVPRSVFGEFAPAPDRVDPVERLASQAATRVPELVPIRYGRMAESPFRFYRGAARRHGRRPRRRRRTAGSRCRCCGDAHLSNFRCFASPERRLVFDINDFDETLPGPWEWDVKRLAASLVIAARDERLRPRGARLVRRRGAVLPRGDARASPACRTSTVWYTRFDVERAAASSSRPRLDAGRRKRLEEEPGEGPDPRQPAGLRASSPTTVDGRLRIVGRPAAAGAAAGSARRIRRGRAAERMHGLLHRYYGRPCRPTGGCCWSSTASSTWPARWSAWAASGPAAG